MVSVPTFADPSACVVRDSTEDDDCPKSCQPPILVPYTGSIGILRTPPSTYYSGATTSPRFHGRCFFVHQGNRSPYSILRTHSDQERSGISLRVGKILRNQEGARTWHRPHTSAREVKRHLRKSLGVELGFFRSSSDFLPGFLSGFLVQANYTFTDATGLIFPMAISGRSPIRRRSAKSPCRSASKAYLQRGCSVTRRGRSRCAFAGTYRDLYLDEAESDAEIGTASSTACSSSISRAVYTFESRTLQVYFEWVNINDARILRLQPVSGPGGRIFCKFEKYNWTM